MNKIFT